MEKNISKKIIFSFIKQVPVHAKNGPLVTIMSLLLGSFVIGTAIILLAKHVNRGNTIRTSLPRNGHCGTDGGGPGGVRGHHNNTSLMNHSIEATWPDSDHRGKFHRLLQSDQEFSNDNTLVGHDIVVGMDEDAYEEDEIYTRKRSLPHEKVDASSHMMKCDTDEDDDEDTASYYTDKDDSWSDLEVDDELVEDQLLPDSELKSGLELLFLKQQRHYWNQTRRHNQSRESSGDK